MMLNADVRKVGGGWSNADTCGQGGGGYKTGLLFADVLCGRPLISILPSGLIWLAGSILLWPITRSAFYQCPWHI